MRSMRTETIILQLYDDLIATAEKMQRMCSGYEGGDEGVKHICKMVVTLLEWHRSWEEKYG